ncbi:MAG: hypothetical protein AAFV88_04635 [Planctomycetota bacterium]
MPPNRRFPGNRKPWMRLTSSGMEIAICAIALGVVGLGFDSWLDLEKPYCSAAGGLVGFSLGMVRLIRLATQLNSSQSAPLETTQVTKKNKDRRP